MATETLNKASIYFNYSSPTSTYASTADSNISKVFIIDSGISLTKSSDKSVYSSSDEILYSLVLKNLSTTSIANIIVIDTLPTGINFVSNSLQINSIQSPSSNITLGVSIPYLLPNSTSTITFKSTIQDSNITSALNVSKMSFDILVNSTPTNVSLNSNANTILIVNKRLNFSKFQLATNLQVGDTGTYTLLVSNSGSVPFFNLTVFDTLPNNLEYIPNTLSLNGVLNPSNPSSGIFIPSLNPGAGVLISFNFKVINTLNNGIAKNKALVSYSYNGPTSPISESMYSNETTLNILLTKLSVYQSASKKEAFVGDTITYSINISNIGTVPVTDIIALTTLPIFSLGYVPNSLTVDGVPVLDNNIISGVSIPDLLVNGISTVTFSVVVLNDSVKEIVNFINILYNSISIPAISFLQTSNYQYETTSNPWSLYILNPSLSVMKSSNVSSIISGNNVIYTISLKNTGSDSLSNVVFFDTLPSSMTFLSGTLYTGVVTLPINNPIYGISLPNIEPNQTFTLSILANSFIVT